VFLTFPTFLSTGQIFNASSGHGLSSAYNSCSVAGSPSFADKSLLIIGTAAFICLAFIGTNLATFVLMSAIVKKMISSRAASVGVVLYFDLSAIQFMDGTCTGP
jgi:hypothetical protein